MANKTELEMSLLEQVTGGSNKTKKIDKKILREFEKYVREHPEDLLQG